jgi:hypothetical protein
MQSSALVGRGEMLLCWQFRFTSTSAFDDEKNTTMNLVGQTEQKNFPSQVDVVVRLVLCALGNLLLI